MTRATRWAVAGRLGQGGAAQSCCLLVHADAQSSSIRVCRCTAARPYPAWLENDALLPAKTASQPHYSRNKVENLSKLQEDVIETMCEPCAHPLVDSVQA